MRNTTIPCTTCTRPVSYMALFPGDICVDCYRVTPEANAPWTAADIRRAFGGAR